MPNTLFLSTALTDWRRATLLPTSVVNVVTLQAKKKYKKKMERIAVKYSTIRRLYRVAVALAVFTISYSLAAGIISVNFGFEDESLALFGFGIESLFEGLSGFWIVTMIIRTKSNSNNRTNFERAALRTTAFSFYILAAGLTGIALFIFYTGHKPETTIWGIVMSMISIAIISALIYGKLIVGMRLRSAAILADANCSKVYIYMSIVLFLSSAIYEATGLLHIDSIGALGVAYFSFRKGNECFEKLRMNQFNELQ